MYATTRFVSHGKFALERIGAGEFTPSPGLIPPAPDVTLAMETNLVAQKQKRRGEAGKWEYQKAQRPSRRDRSLRQVVAEARFGIHRLSPAA